MAFDWHEYLVIADEIAKDPREAMQRSSISRAYYAVYHLGFKSRACPQLHGGNPKLTSKALAVVSESARY
jgi:hypothetical protein